MSSTKSLHYDLCCKAAKWLRQRKNRERMSSGWKYVTVELNVVGAESADVWAFNGEHTVMIEVKTSRNDFLRDKKKFWRQDGSEEYRCGNYRYYLAPEGIIKKEDLPENWGLLEWNGKEISRVIDATLVETNGTSDMRILSSLLRREKFKEGIYNYRGTNTTIKHKDTKLF